MNKRNAFIALSLLFALPATAFAKSYEVRMLNSSSGGAMVFDPAFLKIKKGDSVKFVATDPGHDISSIFVPAGAKPWSGAAGKGTEAKFSKDGIYLYQCKTHIAMAMVGVIEVENSNNLPAAQAAAHAAESQFVMNKDRFSKLLSQIN